MTVETASQKDRQLLTEFATHGNEEAFGELVRRHGPMVLGVCRQMLRNEQDAEDAFQATFLVLARKAGSITNPEALSNWLYSVATRLATRNRLVAGRRHAREVPLTDTQASEPESRQQHGELWSLLCEEIGRLPERYRVPVVLCYLDGKSNEQAAKELKCAPGTIFSRLARARNRLRERLRRRGLVVSSSLLAATLAALPREAFAELSPELLHQTIRSAVLYSAGGVTSTAAISARVKQLATYQIALLSYAVVKPVAVVLLSVALIGTVSGFLIWRTIGRGPGLLAKADEATVVLGQDSRAERASVNSVEEQFKGVWLLQSMTLDGDPFDHGDTPPRVGYLDHGVMTANGVVTGNTYRIDTQTKPMRLYWTIQGKTLANIFEVQGDTLTVCSSLQSQKDSSAPPPTDFTSGKGKVVCIYSRVRP
jgi:RNA polymerase sigma factor (sigma-70 family)